MILCLDVGNSHIFGGVFVNDEIQFRFRYATQKNATSDQLGLFLKQVLHENALDPDKLEKIAISSVVPAMDYTISAACVKYFDLTPSWLKYSPETGISVNFDHPEEIGADRVANCIAGIARHPQTNLIILDMGTATTFDVVSDQHEFLGGVIMPGLKIAMESLTQNTAKLSPVEIIKPEKNVGVTTASNIQSGLYYGHLGAIKLICENIIRESFQGKPTKILATGGFSHLFEKENCFDEIIPDLVLHGIFLHSR